MKKMTVHVCPVCEAQRNFYEFNGKCQFCNTDIFAAEIELPEVDSSSRLIAMKQLELNKTGVMELAKV